MKLSRKADILEKNNALEGVFWTIRQRWDTIEELYKRLLLFSPFRYKPFVKSFSSFVEYERWKKKQKNPWLW